MKNEQAEEKRIPVLIADDEPQIRMILTKMIERHGGFAVTAAVSDFAGAIAAFTSHRPRVVFMDIDLADGISDSEGIKGRSGLACAKIMTDLDPQVKIVFATAHSEYMANAFEIYAFDYLVKPFDMQRLGRTLDKLSRECAAAAAPGSDPIGHASATAEGSTKETAKETAGDPEGEPRREEPKRLIVKGREKTWFIDQKEIIMIEHRNGSSVIVTDTREYETSLALASLEESLDPRIFFRCHKSYIINTERITSAEVYGRWTYVIHLKGTESTALMTAQNYEQLKKRL